MRWVCQALRREEGYILFWAIIVTLMGLLIAIPVARFAGNAFRGTAHVEDTTRAYYAADATVRGIMEDLKRGADADPVPPHTYAFPVPSFGDLVPAASVTTLESETLSVVKPVDHKPSGEPSLLQGFNPFGGRLQLLEDDNDYYRVTGAGEPTKVVWEVSSEVIEFPSVSFGEIRVTLQSSKSDTKIDLFIFNPDDPNHIQNGYNPIADASLVMELANIEQTVQVFLEGGDVAYLNSLPAKQLRLKLVATRTGGFTLQTDQVVFTAAGVVTVDLRKVKGSPTIITGSLLSGGGRDMDADDASYFKMSSSGRVVEYEVFSDNFSFSQIDDVELFLIVRSNRDDVIVELYLYNSTDAQHIDGGYAPGPDLETTIPLNNVDKAISLSVPESDVAFLNSQFPMSLRLKVRATYNSDFQFESDLLTFTATSSSAPAQVVAQVTQQYFDPGLMNPQFASLAPREGYLLRIYNMHSGFLKVNWAYHTSDFRNAATSLLVFRGLVVDKTTGTVLSPGGITTKPAFQGNDLIESASAKPREPFLQTDFVKVDAGVYTIVFFNDSPSTLITEPFAATGAPQDTWVYAPAFKDYLIDVMVGEVGLKAVIRQIPGPTEPPVFPWGPTNISWIENMVLIQSWEPYGEAPS